MIEVLIQTTDLRSPDIVDSTLTILCMVNTVKPIYKHYSMKPVKLAFMSNWSLSKQVQITRFKKEKWN